MPMSQREQMQVIGNSPIFLDLLDQVSKVAPLDRPVLVIGERGTGKELVAARLHFLSRRWENPFVKLNCASLPENLIESELFGYEQGAFTGATRQRVGRFEQADGGSIFLDEVASLSPSAQEKLLRVVEYGEFDRVGGNKTIEVDARVVAAANLDLPSLADRGRFRHDLLDRLAFDVLTIPPLRARKSDIMVLAQYFSAQMARELNCKENPRFTKRVAETLQDYHWPGNVRELKNVVERAVYNWSDEGGPIETIIFDPFESPWRPKDNKIIEGVEGASPQIQQPENISAIDIRSPVDLKLEMQKIEKKLISDALQFNKFNQRQTARHLKLSYDQFRHTLKKHGI